MEGKDEHGNLSVTLLAKFDGLIRPLFIETGTNTGNTLAEASKVFERCISIEQADSYFQQATERFAEVPNVKLYKGDSPTVLREVIEAEMATTFWLDAHYFGNGDTLGPSSQCPLMAELRSILSFWWPVKPIILIDDAFMFDEDLLAPDCHEPFWTSNQTDHTNYNRIHWPKIRDIDELMAGYRKTIRDGYILQYD